MYFTKSSVVAFSLLASSSLVAGHGAIIGATGDAGGQGSAIGVDPATPRDGTNRNPFQQDSTRFRGDAAATCGETLGGGANDVDAGTAQVMQMNGGTLPQVTAGGQIMMTVHQVNSDGAGPYKCMIDASGTGTNWQPITVTQNLPGNDRGRNRDTQMQDLPLTASIPAGMTCTGTVAGASNVCMVRCENPARAGPFGGCVPVQMAGAAAAPAAAAPAAGAAAGAAAAPAAGAASPAAAAPVAGAASPAAAGAASPAAAGVAAPAAAGVAAPAAAGVAAPAAAGVASPAAAGVAAPAAAAPAAAAGANSASAVRPAAKNVVQVVAPAASGAAAVQSASAKAVRSFPAVNAVRNVVPIVGAAARKRAALRNSQPKLTNDDQEEEVDLVDSEF